MNHRIYLILIIIASLFGYLEWGDQTSFLWEIEYQILKEVVSNPLSLSHPFIGIPILGQLVLLINIFISKPRKISIYIGIGLMAILFLMILFVGIISSRYLIVLSTIPFFILSVLSIRYTIKR